MKEHDECVDSLEEGMLEKLKEREAKQARPRTKKQYDDMEISAHGLKIQFAGLLEKLGESDTREQAMNQIQKLINDYCNPETLRIYISILKGLKRTVTNSATKENQVLVIAYLCQRYKTNLIDPIDKPPNLVKTVFRVVELIHSYFNDVSLTVQEACARALIDAYAYCLQGQAVQSKLSLIFLPLVSILTSGMDRASQSTASVCISELISYWYSKGELDIIKRVEREVLFVFLKANTEFYTIMNAVATCLKISGITYLEGKFSQFIAKLLLLLNDNDRNSAKPTPPLNAYMGKVEACKLLTTVAKLAADKQDCLSQIKPLDVLAELDKASRNKLIQVQRAAREAIESWRLIAGLDQAKPPESPMQESAAKQQSPFKLSSLNEMRQKFKREKSKSREHSEETSKTRQKIEQQLKFMKEDLGELVKGKGWGPQNRGQNFVKKGTGVGGGHVGNLDNSPGNKGRKNYDTHIKELRKYVQQERQARKTDPEQFPQWNDKPEAPKEQVKNPSKPQAQAKAIDVRVETHKKPEPPKVNLPKNVHFINPSKYDLDQFQVAADDGDQQALPAQRQMTFQRKPTSASRKEALISERADIPTEQLLKDLEQYEKPVTRTPLTRQPPVKNPEPVQNIHDILSREQIKQLMEQGQHLSAVSSFLGGVMSEKDLDEQAMSRLDSQVMEKEEDYLCVRQLKNQKRQSNLRETADKFLKRSVVNINPKTNNSLEFSQSKNKTHREQEESLRLELSKVNPPESQPSPQRQPPSKPVSEQPKEELPAQEEESILSEYERSQMESHRPVLENPPSKPLSNVAEMFSAKKLPNQEYVDEFQGKNFQSMIIKPPKPDRREIRTAGNFRPKEEVPAPLAASELQQLADDGLLDQWKDILSLIDQGDINEAYRSVFELGTVLLNTDDSVYLLRCMLLAGPSFDKLTAESAKQLWLKFSDIYQSRFFDILTLSMFTQAHELDLVGKTLNLQQSNYLLKSLYQMSGQLSGRVSYRSAVLYNEIDARLRK